MQKNIGLMVLFLFATASVWGVSFADEETWLSITVPLSTLVLQAPAGVETKRTVVAFPHGNHFDYACKKCHHNWDGHSEIKTCTTSGCHDQTATSIKSEKAVAPASSPMRYYKQAYHQACIQCHRTLKLENTRLAQTVFFTKTKIQKTGPTGCIGCHKKD